jgi:intracellular sulfur oxidation DsrE/DsrF family protein
VHGSRQCLACQVHQLIKPVLRFSIIKSIDSMVGDGRARRMCRREASRRRPKVRCFVLDDVNVDVVTYGPGLHMLRADTSPVKDHITSLKDAAFPSKIQFSVCGNTKEGMEKKEGQPITVLSEAVVVPSGVVRLMELQETGWSYVRP